MREDGLEALARFVEGSERLFVLTGAGLSTRSGIPDYRDDDGDWKRRAPVQYRDFVHKERTRRLYWSRSLVGWRVVAEAEPNAAHEALAAFERAGRLHHLVTQNVDALHQKAGSTRVIDLHGRLDGVVCLGCGDRTSRHALQAVLERDNPAWADLVAETAPDGDADLQGPDVDTFRVPVCEACGGTLKPDVVFFGENVPTPRVEEAYARLAEADAVLVVGSSLMVFSGFRFVKAAHAKGVRVAALNRGRTRADDLLTLKVEGDCTRVLPAMLERYGLTS